MENSTCKAPFLLVFQGPYEQQNFLNRKPRHTEAGSFSLVTPEPQVPGIPQSQVRGPHH